MGCLTEGRLDPPPAPPATSPGPQLIPRPLPKLRNLTLCPTGMASCG